jgi:hypothetical protein
LGIEDWAKISQKLKAKSKKKEFFLLPFYFSSSFAPYPMPDAHCPSPQSLVLVVTEITSILAINHNLLPGEQL